VSTGDLNTCFFNVHQSGSRLLAHMHKQQLIQGGASYKLRHYDMQVYTPLTLSSPPDLCLCGELAAGATASRTTPRGVHFSDERGGAPCPDAGAAEKGCSRAAPTRPGPLRGSGSRSEPDRPAACTLARAGGAVP